MTRKDYEVLAAALADARPTANENKAWHSQHCIDALAVADALARDNARFDRARFLKACGVAA